MMVNESIPGGLLVAIEGIDGAGKTTLAQRLAARLHEAWAVPVTLSKEPTNGPHGARLRATAITGRLAPDEELRLLLADRREHIHSLVAPALAGGGVVILDRYYFSNAAYQGAEGLDVQMILDANQAFAPEPDLTILLDLTPEHGLARIEHRGDFANSFETVETLTAARRIFLDAMPAHGKAVVIDATRDAETVFIDALAAVVVAAAGKIRDALGVTPASVSNARKRRDNPWLSSAVA
jgi:dTMP kinase